MSVREEFAFVLHDRRVRMGLKPSELAKMVGKSQQWMWKVEKGDISVSLENAQLLADALDISLVDLLARRAPLGGGQQYREDLIHAEQETVDARHAYEAAEERWRVARGNVARLRRMVGVE